MKEEKRNKGTQNFAQQIFKKYTMQLAKIAQ